MYAVNPLFKIIVQVKQPPIQTRLKEQYNLGKISGIRETIAEQEISASAKYCLKSTAKKIAQLINNGGAKNAGTEVKEEFFSLGYAYGRIIGTKTGTYIGYIKGYLAGMKKAITISKPIFLAKITVNIKEPKRPKKIQHLLNEQYQLGKINGRRQAIAKQRISAAEKQSPGSTEQKIAHWLSKKENDPEKKLKEEFFSLGYTLGRDSAYKEGKETGYRQGSLAGKEKIASISKRISEFLKGPL